MECQDAQMAISARFDGESVPGELTGDVDAHCDSCSECAEFRRHMQALAAIEPARPPADLVGRTIAAVAQVAAADAGTAQEANAAANAPVVEVPSSKNEGRRQAWVWAGSTAAIVVAALLVFAVVRLTGAPGGATTGTRTDLATGAGPEASKAAAPSAIPSPATAPPYVTLGEFVYRVGDVIQASASQLITAGTIVSSMGGGDTPATLAAFTLAGQPDALVVLKADGTYVACQAVVRQFQGVRYQLVSGTPIRSFGTWPDLPQYVSRPGNGDGSPGLTPAGTDARGVTILQTLGGSLQAGIGVAPGTSADDPAAGNPGWTWWRPVNR